MSNKITLITPPDIYENSNRSILFVDIDEKDQQAASVWLAQKDFKDPLNFYIFSGEPSMVWLLHAAGVCEHKFVNLDSSNTVSRELSSYLLSKNNFYYKTKDENLAAIYSHINTNRVSTIEKFLEKVLND
jgi:hypothetical protein